MAIQYFTDQDLNGNRTRDASDAVLAQDYVTLAQLQAAVASINGFSATFGDGVSTTFNIVHGLNTLDVVVAFQEISSGDGVEMGWSTNGVNSIDVTATPAIGLNTYRITVLPRA
jgi:hypothetical protein